jgi:hypothetical protein
MSTLKTLIFVVPEPMSKAALVFKHSLLLLVDVLAPKPKTEGVVTVIAMDVAITILSRFVVLIASPPRIKISQLRRSLRQSGATSPEKDARTHLFLDINELSKAYATVDLDLNSDFRA